MLLAVVHGAYCFSVDSILGLPPVLNDPIPVLSQTLIYSLRRLHAALQLLTDNHMNDTWSRIPNGRVS